jgi:hypothetical protein
VGSKEEPGMQALLVTLAAALYAVTWLLAGPPGGPGAPAPPTTGPLVGDVSLLSRPLGPELLAGLH